MLSFRAALKSQISLAELRQKALLSEFMCPTCVLPLRPQIVGAERHWLCVRCRTRYRPQ